MKKMKLLKVVSTVMMVVNLVTGVGTTNVFAAEVDNTPNAIETDGDIETRAGVETLPLNKWHTISSSFSVAGYNYTPCKTVEGRYLKLDFDCYVGDSGGNIVALVQIRDYNTKELLNEQYHMFIITKNHDAVFTPHVTTKTFDLGQANRKIQIYTKLVSADSVDNFERTATFKNYKSYVSNQ